MIYNQSFTLVLIPSFDLAIPGLFFGGWNADGIPELFIGEAPGSLKEWRPSGLPDVPKMTEFGTCRAKRKPCCAV